MNLKQLAKTWFLPPGFVTLANRLRDARTRYWSRTAEERRLLAKTNALFGRHRGRRCFVLGAGSSVREQDLKKLAGEIVISVSNTFVHPDFPLIRPRYHVLPALLAGHGELYSAEKFVVWLKEMEARTSEAEMFLHIGDRAMILENDLFSGRTVHWVDYCYWDGAMDTRVDLSRIPNIWSVSEAALTVAVAFDFDAIYLLGIDHDWFRGPLVYFYDHSKQHAMRPDKNRLDFVDAEFQMRRHAEIFKKYKYLQGVHRSIFNANADPAHYLDVFPKVDYESLFQWA